ncbi:unnamed protein product [Mycena citricolor]|uniref:Ricin B lectin domain-containing protein n=1 Tax=Mycena citricolor TaxID=2018698 RepID=A0AAD2HKE6_9AGAR|nr:unnamed protein product [Mycena citricolor]
MIVNDCVSSRMHKVEQIPLRCLFLSFPFSKGFLAALQSFPASQVLITLSLRPQPLFGLLHFNLPTAMFTSTLLTLLSVSASLAAPIRRDVTLDATATAEAQRRDATATRAFSGVPIKTSSGKCLSVNPFSGDFRENLTPVNLVDCNGSANQTWDVITAGVHNNAPGTALIVSALTQACLNFDPRRAAGNQVLLFSCGGRADGGGSVTNSQQFAFNGGSGPIPLAPLNGNNQTCLTAGGKLLDQTACNPATASGNLLFTIGSGSGSAAAPPPPPPPATTAASAPTNVAAAAPALQSVTLDQTAVAEAQVRDNTATRAASSVPIKDSTGKCLTVNANSGDFRENLTPVTVQACDGSAGQNWDVVTAGKHNNVAGTALVVSALTQACLNFDPRRAAGNQVLLFSCGGRADGGGLVTNSQLFTFSGAGSIPLQPTNQAGTCFFNNNGFLDQQACNNGAAQLFTIGSGSAVAAPPAATTAAAAKTTAAAPATTAAVPATTAAAAAPPLKSVTLDLTAVAESMVRDNTATRAASSVPIKDSTGKCLTVNANSGDFRENLIPVTVQACDGSAGQNWDVITAGKHNNAAGSALVVSALTQGCLNFDPRRAAGNQVLLFSCGGRADGGGSVTNSQLFTFTGASKSIPLQPENQAGTCLFNNNGFLDQQSCNNAGSQVFTIG